MTLFLHYDIIPPQLCLLPQHVAHLHLRFVILVLYQQPIIVVIVIVFLIDILLLL